MRTSAPVSCMYCGPQTIHVGICPRIVEIEYHPGGSVKRVRFQHDRTILDWPDDPRNGLPTKVGA